MKKKLLAILLTVCMVLSMAPAALAADSVFTDVNAGDWFAEEVEYVYDNGLMNGVGDNKFDPSGTVTRAMVWTTLARLDGVDTTGSDPWWLAGQQWAIENEISDGTMATENITREQLVTMIWRYAKYIEMDVSEGEDTNILSYTDALDVNEWAVSAMQWACGVGIINGIDGTLQPQGYATRAQLAAILYRFVEEVMPGEEEPEPSTPVVPSYPSYPVIPPHSHNYGSWTANDDGTHTGTCSCTGTTTENCTYTNGVCSKCGFVEGSAAKIGDEYYATAQEALDAAVDGDTIELFTGNHGDLVFRVTEDSELVDNAYYYMSNYNSSYYGQANWQYARRTINGLTITGVEGAIINSFTTSDARDDNGNAKGTRNNMFEITNLTISGITIANGISFNTSDVQVANSETTTTIVPHVKIDGLTIDNCKTTTDGDTGSTLGRKLLGIANTSSASNVKNIVVTNCTVTDMYQGVYVVDGENVRIEGNSFSGVTHNSIHINKHCSGTITISGNTIDNVTDRPIRFSGVQSGTVTISNNTITNSEGDNGQYFKASAMSSDVALTWENNTIDGVGIVLTTSGTDVIGIKATSKIGSVYYATAQEALDAAVDGDTIELFAGNHGDLVFRVNEDSELVDCYYFMSNYDSSFYGQEEWRFAKRTIDGLTIIGAEGAVIDSFTASLPRDDDGNAKGTRNNLFEIANLKFSNLTITNGIKLNTGDVTVAVEEGTVVVPRLKIDGLTIDNCKTPDTGDNSKDAWRVLVSIGNEGTNSNAKDIVVTNCVVKSTYQGVYIVDGVNVLIENNSFSNITHNSIHVNDHCSGTIVVTGNTMDTVQDRPIRFNGVQSGTVTISNNAITNSTGDNGQYFKASAMGSDVALTWENNTIDGVAIALTTSGADTIGIKSAALIGSVGYATAQEALDAAKDGDTIKLLAGNHGDLVIRANDSSEFVADTYYYMSNYGSNYYGQSEWQFVKRTINNLTITGVEGATINSLTTSDARDDEGNAKGTRNNLFEINNLTISGLTIANGISFNTSDVTVAVSESETALVPHVKLDGLTIDSCKTTTSGETGSNPGRKLLGIANTGSNSNAKNIVVTNCTITDMYQGIYVVDGENVRIENNSFSGLTHNTIHVNKHCSGTIIISGNTINSVSDRPIRFNGVQSGTVTISNNTITNSSGDNGQYFKASAMSSDVTLNWENNTADGAEIVTSISGTDIVGTKSN